MAAEAVATAEVGKAGVNYLEVAATVEEVSAATEMGAAQQVKRTEEIVAAAAVAEYLEAGRDWVAVLWSQKRI